MKYLVIIFLLMAVNGLALDLSLYQDAQGQCLDRYDRVDCLAYFQEVLINQTHDVQEESYTRKEGRYEDILAAEQEDSARFFHEEYDSAARKINPVKQKALRVSEARALRQLREGKSAAAGSLRDYAALVDKASCQGLDEAECSKITTALELAKKQSLLQLTDAVSHAVTAMQAFVQRSPYLAEKDAAVLNSELNQQLAQSRVLHAHFGSIVTDADIIQFSKVVSEVRMLNRKVSLLHTYGQLYSIFRRLSLMHITWERKAIHYPQNGWSDHLETFATSLDAAGLELRGAFDTVSRLEVEETLVQLRNVHTLLHKAANKERILLRLLSHEDIPFMTPYDVLEELIDNRRHGISPQTNEAPLDEFLIAAKLYPEKGETVVIVSQDPPKQFVFPTIDEEQLIALIAQKLGVDGETVKQQLRFELGGK
ncbi:hypothetical protein HY639_04535 [Candidatus Woesearchaeota archaeon]|nr:hypothetical protein [Candidatus Woesearchaeota archaeon]